MIKVHVPSAILRVLDRAIQAFGGAGVSQVLQAWARTLMWYVWERV